MNSENAKVMSLDQLMEALSEVGLETTITTLDANIFNQVSRPREDVAHY